MSEQAQAGAAGAGGGAGSGAQGQASGGGQGAGGAAPPLWYSAAAPEIIGHWQTRGLDLSDPAKVAIEVTKQYREAERHIGAPPQELLRIPKPTAAATDVKAFWERLGVPKAATEYDLASVKFNGADLEQGFADTMRQALLDNFIPKERAAPIVGAVVKWLEGQETAETAAQEAKWAAETARLDASWGTNKSKNMLDADQGAQRLGVKPEEVKAMADVIGRDRVAELFRRIGAGTKEDTFHPGTQGNGGQPATREAAASRLDELQKDRAWVDRLLKGDARAREEFHSLQIQATGWVPDPA